MIPKLWNYELNWSEWRRNHTNLNEQVAQQLYMAESMLFQAHYAQMVAESQMRQAQLANLTLGPIGRANTPSTTSTLQINLTTDEGLLLITDEGDQLIV